MAKFCQAVQSRTAFLAAALAMAGALAVCAEEKRPADPAAVSKEAVDLSNAGQYAEAKARFELAARLDPANATVHQGLGLVCMRLRLFAEARAALEKAVSLNQKLPAAQASLGLIYEHLALEAGRKLMPAEEKAWREKAMNAWKAVLSVETDRPRLDTARKHLDRLERR